LRHHPSLQQLRCYVTTAVQIRKGALSRHLLLLLLEGRTNQQQQQQQEEEQQQESYG
jgi:hypothetical protein